MTNHALTHHNKALQTILLRVDQLRELNRLVAEHLPTEMIKHCEVIKLEKNCLFVLVTSGSWATQLRFHIPELMKKLKNYPLLAQLSGIICKTHPTHLSANIVKQQPKRIVKQLSQETSEMLLKTAEKVRDDRLKHILKKIAQNC